MPDTPKPPARVHEQADKAEGRHLRPVAGGGKIMKPAHAKPSAIIFDWDNTLIDSWETIHEALVMTFAEMGHKPWTLAETKRRVSHSLKNSFPKLFGERWTEARKIYLDSYAAIHLDRIAPIPGAEALLRDLHAKGFYLAVISNKTGASLRIEAAHIGWAGYFARLIGAGDASHDKPDPAGFGLALEGSGIDLGRLVWYVGDTALDMESANAAGATGVLLGEPLSPAEELAKFPPDLRFPGCDSLRQYLLSL
jgi:phosphoglycolate phosphatase